MFQIHGMLAVLIISLAVSSVSMTISKALVFKRFRDFLSGKNYWLGKLVSCPYCLSHWVSLFFVIIYRPKIITMDYQIIFSFIIEYATSLFVVVTFASFWSFLICHTFMAMDSLGGEK